MDSDGSGDVTLEEFVTGCMQLQAGTCCCYCAIVAITLLEKSLLPSAIAAFYDSHEDGEDDDNVFSLFSASCTRQ